MKTSKICPTAFLLSLALTISPTLLHFAAAEESTEIESEVAEESKSSIPSEVWSSEVKTKYSLSDEQMKALNESGLKGPQLAVAAELAKASGKTINEVIALRTTEKMGWGAIAKKLGLPPSTIGHSVASMRKSVHDKQKENRIEKREEKKTEKREAREERRNLREERKQQRASEKKAH